METQATQKDRLICGCMRIYQSQIEEAVRNGAHTFTEVQNATKAATSCGNCRPLIERVIRQVLADAEANA